jgi:hypothetical protein
VESAYVSVRQRTSAYVRIRPHTSAYVSIRRHTSAYVSIRQHTPYRYLVPVLRWRQRQYLYFCTSKASKLQRIIYLYIYIYTHTVRVQKKRTVRICTVVLVKQVNFSCTCGPATRPGRSISVRTCTVVLIKQVLVY